MRTRRARRNTAVSHALLPSCAPPPQDSGARRIDLLGAAVPLLLLAAHEPYFPDVRDLHPLRVCLAAEEAPNGSVLLRIAHVLLDE